MASDKHTRIQNLNQTTASLSKQVRWCVNVLRVCIVCENVAIKYTMRYKFSNFHLIFKLQIGMKMKRNKIFSPSIFDALAIIIS